MKTYSDSLGCSLTVSSSSFLRLRSLGLVVVDPLDKNSPTSAASSRTKWKNDHDGEKRYLSTRSAQGRTHFHAIRAGADPALNDVIVSV